MRILIYLSVVITCSNVLGQSTTCNNTIFSCTANMAKDQFSDDQISSQTSVSYAKIYSGVSDVNYYNSSNSNLNDCGNSAFGDCSFDGSALTLDVYYPNKKFYSCYKTQPLPVIFLFPGGGFSDCVDNAEGTHDYCLAFAKRGFVAVNVNYRTGRLKDTANALSASLFLAMYRAYQDGRGAIRTVISENDTNKNFKIDTGYIFVGGISAGGEISLNIAYAHS